MRPGLKEDGAPMLRPAMQSIASRRGLFVACILAIGAVATSPAVADSDAAPESGAPDDAGPNGDAQAATEAGATNDATAATPDATVGTSGEGGAALDDAMASNGVPYVTPDAAFPPYTGGNIFQLLCVDDPKGATFNFNTVKAPYDAAGCKAYDPYGHKAVHDCYCDNCGDLMAQCDALPGCQQILKCELDSGCTSPTACYLTPINPPCATVINEWGTGSVATALTQYLQQCGQKAMPACPSK